MPAIQDRGLKPVVALDARDKPGHDGRGNVMPTKVGIQNDYP